MNDASDIPVVGLSNAYWSLKVAPRLGGKVVSLYDSIAKREWLWSRDFDRSLNTPDVRQGFGAGNLIGMDELLPTLLAQNGEHWRTHGELWYREVDLDPDSLLDEVIRTQIKLTSTPLRYTREIHLNGRTIFFNYHLENLSHRNVAYLWAMHPLFRIEPGDCFVPDLADGALRVQSSSGLPQIKVNDTIRWPGTAEGIDLSQLALGDSAKAGLKLFTESPEHGVVAMFNRDSSAGLRMKYDVKVLPHLAVWLSRGVWGGAHHLAIEPTNSPNEVPVETFTDSNGPGWLKPGEIREWRVRLENVSVVV